MGGLSALRPFLISNFVLRAFWRRIPFCLKNGRRVLVGIEEGFAGLCTCISTESVDKSVVKKLLGSSLAAQRHTFLWQLLADVLL